MVVAQQEVAGRQPTKLAVIGPPPEPPKWKASGRSCLASAS